MKITLLQIDIDWCNPAANIKRADEAIDRNPGSDLYILPEMFSTGFITEPEGCAESDDSETLHWMLRKAKEVNAAISGSLSVESNGKYYNRHYFVTPDDKFIKYDKSHLFIHGGEGLHYTAGTERVVTEFRGVKILIQTCYDLRFPIWSRNEVDENDNYLYDLIIYVANWPRARQLAWETLVRARALENQCYVAACNRVGKDEWGEYFGKSVIVHPYGHLIGECDYDIECETTGELDMEQLKRYRTKVPTIKDIIWKKDYC